MRTLLKFEADWCGPCQQIKPLVDQVLTKVKNIKLRTVDVDQVENHKLVEQHGVRAIPTLVLLDDKDKVIATHRGSLGRAELESFIEQ